MGCGNVLTDCAKAILICFNMIILLAAAIFIGMGVVYRQKNHGLDLGAATIIPIVLGVLIILIAFFGCFGAINQNPCLLNTYASILIVIFIIQLALGILAFIAIKKGDKNEDETVRDQLKKLYEGVQKRDADDIDAINVLQKDLKCCGLDGRTDIYVRNGTNLMQTCCEDTDEPCTVGNAFEKNCTEAMTDALAAIMGIVGIVAIIFGVIELGAAIFACCIKRTSGYRSTATNYN